MTFRILTAATRRDTSPSVLEHEIHSVVQNHHASKKTKTSEGVAKSSIASLVRSQSYSSPDEIVKDLDLAIEEVFGDTASDDTVIEKPDKEESMKARSLMIELHRILLRERRLRPIRGMDRTLQSSLDALQSTLERKPVINGQIPSGRSAFKAGTHQGKTVLTLLGSAPTPRQLFSSIRHDETNNDKDEKLEHGLPTGISTTRIFPQPTSPSKSEKASRKFGEVFAPSSSQPPLNPPRQARRTTTRNSSIDWFNPVDLMASSGRPNRRDSHPAQPQSTSKWLRYSKDSSLYQLSSPEAKRKQRDRALSFGDTTDTKADQVISALNRAEEDALFHKVYSSFAPDRDSTFAIVPENIKNNVWWSRIGRYRFETIEAALNREISEDVDDLLDGSSEELDPDDELLREAVATWHEDETPSGWELLHDTSHSDELPIQDLDQALREISELLEALHSHQHVRNLQTPTNRTSTSQNASAGGLPTDPSEDEVEVQHKLKDRLIAMVSCLPPYALAKLGGDQLGQLNIIADIPTASDQFRGTMEDEDSNTRAKYSSTSTATLSSRLSNIPSSLTAAPTRPFSTSSTPQNSQRNTYSSQTKVPNSTYQPTQYSNRPAGQYYGASTQPPYPTTAATASRHPYAKSPQFSQNAIPTTNQYSSTHRPFSSTPGAYNQAYSSAPYNSLLQGSQSARSAQVGYPPRTANAASISYNPSPSVRNANPDQSTNSYTAIQRAMGNGQGTPSNHARTDAYYGQGSQYLSQIKSPHGISPVVNSAPNTQLTAEQQAMLISKQKAQNAINTTHSIPKIPSLHQASATAPQSNGIANGNSQ